MSGAILLWFFLSGEIFLLDRIASGEVNSFSEIWRSAKENFGRLFLSEFLLIVPLLLIMALSMAGWSTAKSSPVLGIPIIIFSFIASLFLIAVLQLYQVDLVVQKKGIFRSLIRMTRIAIQYLRSSLSMAFCLYLIGFSLNLLLLGWGILSGRIPISFDITMLQRVNHSINPLVYQVLMFIQRLISFPLGISISVLIYRRLTENNPILEEVASS
jgi:hypothetical protein